jgi:hypothetical protein
MLMPATSTCAQNGLVRPGQVAAGLASWHSTSSPLLQVNVSVLPAPSFATRPVVEISVHSQPEGHGGGAALVPVPAAPAAPAAAPAVPAGAPAAPAGAPARPVPAAPAGAPATADCPAAPTGGALEPAIAGGATDPATAGEAPAAPVTGEPMVPEPAAGVAPAPPAAEGGGVTPPDPAGMGTTCVTPGSPQPIALASTMLPAPIHALILVIAKDTHFPRERTSKRLAWMSPVWGAAPARTRFDEQTTGVVKAPKGSTLANDLLREARRESAPKRPKSRRWTAAGGCRLDLDLASVLPRPNEAAAVGRWWRQQRGSLARTAHPRIVERRTRAFGEKERRCAAPRRAGRVSSQPNSTLDE